MASKLLVRVYDVGLGDCILCRIPEGTIIDGKHADFHMLIDCGSWSGMSFLQTALDDIAAQLPATDGEKKRLDLLVVTHEHKDHMAGCDPVLFEKFRIGASWMSAAMNPFAFRRNVSRTNPTSPDPPIHSMPIFALSGKGCQGPCSAP